MSFKQATILRAVVGIVAVAALTVGGLLITSSLANLEKNQYFEVRELQAAAAAAGIDPENVEALKGESTDEETPEFKEIKEQLIRIKNSDPTIRFVYLMAPKYDKLVFLVDAEEPDSPDYSPPGQVYVEAKPENFEVFDGERAPLPEIEGPITDRWGTWISASAYILADDGKPIALLGTDEDVEVALAAYNRINLFGNIYTILVALLVALAFLQWILYKYNRHHSEKNNQTPEQVAE